MKAIFLENIRSLNNVGAIFRTADGAWFDRVVCIGYTPTPPRKEITKTALWAEKFVPWEYFEHIEEAIAEYRKLGCAIIALEKNKKSVPLKELVYCPPDKGGWRGVRVKTKDLCLIVGNELEWVSKNALKLADFVCHLPMLGKKESLNVAVAAGIAMYHFAQEKRYPEEGTNKKKK